MERYVGLDSHARSCTLGVMSASGQRLKALVVETNGSALIEAVRGIPGRDSEVEVMRLTGVGTPASGEDNANRTVTVVRRSDCSHSAAAVVAIGALAATLGLRIRVEEVYVETDDDARGQKCLGSPTVRLNGNDIEPDVRGSTSFGTT